MHTKHIDICHHFIRYMFKEKDMDINYINSEEKTHRYYNKELSWSQTG